jgi:serine/threonine protein phosphatase PrpC
MTAAEPASTSLSPPGIRAAALSHPGLVRDHNEDAFALVADCGLYVVADGVGGQPGGKTAAHIVARALPELLSGPLTAGDLTEAALRQFLRTTLSRLSHTVRKEAARAGRAGMGSTVVLAVVRNGRATIAHMGDSRAYRFHDGALTVLTADHSVVGILLRQGEITAEQARGHPARGRITRYVGMPEGVDPDVVTTGLEPGDRLLLCTDGLTSVVPDANVAAILAATGADPEAACRRLIDAALAAGARDNVTVLAADRARQGSPVLDPSPPDR